jgi:pyruvate dehydrogenase E2 component (dihydrolipoyllysine-residue acetyltransferase)
VAQFLMPKLSDTMEEGTVLRWFHQDGEEVAKGDPLVEVETDKATMTVEAPESGRLSIIAGEGESRPVGEAIAAIGEGSEAAAPSADGGAPAEAAAPDGAGAADDGEEQTNIPVGDDGTGSEIGMEVTSGPAQAPAPASGRPARSTAKKAAPAAGGASRVKASPLARRLATELGVDLALVRGSGPDGRVVKEDVEAAARGDAKATRDAPGAPSAPAPDGAPAPAAPPAAAAPEPPAPEAPRPAPGQRIALNRLQRTIARRMLESTTQAPHFYLQRDIDVTDALALRRTLVAASPAGEGPSLNDLVLRAVAIAASERPDAVARFDGDAIVIPEAVHIGVAVAVERGLLVPVLRDAPSKSVGRIASEVRDLASRCRDGTITAAELEGSVITVSNLGMFGVDRFFAVINPPEAAILAVGRAAARAVVRDGEIVARDVMTVTLSVDHRTLYGAEGATFLGRIAELLESPGGLVL